MKLIRTALCGVEAEGPRECLGTNQVRLFELQPRDVDDFDHRIAGSARVLAGQRSVLAVQVFMRVPVGFDVLIHHHLPIN